MSSQTRHISGFTQLLTMLSAYFSLLIKHRKTRALGIIQLIPVVSAAVYVAFQNIDGLMMFTGVTENLVFPFLLPLVAIAFGGPVVVDEMEGRTLTYLTTRPIAKPLIYCGKLLASILIVLVLVIVPLLLLFLLCLWQSSDFSAAMQMLGTTTGAVALAAVVYVCVFAALGAIFASSLVSSVVYFVIVEMIFASLPVIEVVSVRYHMRNLAGVGGADRFGVLDQLILDQPLVFEWWVSLIFLLFIALVGVVAGAWAFREKQYLV